MHNISIYVEYGKNLLATVEAADAQAYLAKRDTFVFTSGRVNAQLSDIGFSEFQRNRYEQSIMFIYSLRDVIALLPHNLDNENAEHNSFNLLRDYISLLELSMSNSNSLKSFLMSLETNANTEEWLAQKSLVFELARTTEGTT